ncbi:MAG TPA: PIN domain-containing protein [Longimicrobium sp.]|jgi:predicted nucleic acid-binding protein
MIRIYLDSCCFSRLFDEQTQTRIRAETEAIRLILSVVARGEWELIHSEAVEAEAATIPDPERRREVLALAATGTVRLPFTPEHIERARVLKMLGFKSFDALHVVSAEAAGAHVLLTTDDGMIRRARRFTDKLFVRIDNPLTWLQEVAPR